MVTTSSSPLRAFAKGPDLLVGEETVGDLLRDAESRGPDRIALVEGVADRDARRRWTYSALLRDSEQVARALMRMYPVGSRVAVWAPNVPEYQVVQYGIALAGMVMVTINPAFRSREARYVIEHSGAAAVFTIQEFRGRDLMATAVTLASELESLEDVVDLERLPDFVDPDDILGLPDVDAAGPAQILYTSGTTGAPKGAVLSHRAMTNNVRSAALLITAGKTEDVVWLAALPMFHLAGCVVAALGTASLHGTLLVVRSFDADLVLQLLAEENISTTNIVPTLMWALLHHPDFLRVDRSSLHSVMLGGASIPPHLAQELTELGIVPIVGYGLTEAPVISMTKDSDTVIDKVTTCGTAVPGVEIRICDPTTNQPLSLDELGEVQSRGFLNLLGYFNDKSATSAAMTSEGWFKTGDLGTLDERGYLRIAGRSKDMIIRGGENVYPREIEDRLVKEAEVADVAVVGLPDDYYGEIVGAFVRRVPGSDMTAHQLRELLKDEMSGYKVPAKWFFVDGFPETPSGKIQKFALRAGWEGGEYTEEAVR